MPTMDYQKRINKFYEGKMSQKEAEEFLQFLESQEAEDYFSAELIELWTEKIKSNEYEWDNVPLLDKIKKSKNGYAKPFLSQDRKVIKFWARSWVKVASIIFIVGLTALLFIINRQSAVEKDSLELNELITKSNPKGQKSKVKLEDGSIVFLNSASSISYSKNFIENRTIHLEGEAFFEVAKDSLHPFSVEAKGVITTALGTSFNISAFQEKEKVIITLLTGKVNLKQEGSSKAIEMYPGEESTAFPSEKRFEKHKVDASEKVLWTEGILRFKEASFQEMVEVLERWYAVQIKVIGTPKELYATGVFDSQESLRNVLNAMSQTLEFEFEIEEKIITIKFN